MDGHFKLMSGLALLVIATSIGVALSSESPATSRQFGSSVSLAIPPGAQLVSMTWKDDSLWHLYYLPGENTCVFKENSLLGVLEGSVTVPNCNLASNKQGVRNAED